MLQGEVQSPDLGSEKNKKNENRYVQNYNLSEADIYQENLTKICSN